VPLYDASPYSPISLPQIELSKKKFIFSGGASNRDYETLFEAVKKLDIHVKVARTGKASKVSIFHRM